MDNEPETRRKGEGLPGAARGAISASVKDTTVRKKGRGFADAAQSQVGKTGAASASTEDPSTGRKGGEVSDAMKSQGGQRGGASASKSRGMLLPGEKGRGSSRATLVPVGQTGAASAEDPSTRRKGREVPDAMKSQVGQRGATSDSKARGMRLPGGKGRGSSPAMLVPVGQTGAASAEDPSTRRKERGVQDPMKSQVGQRGGASASKERGLRLPGGKGRGSSPATLVPVGKSGASVEDGTTRSKGREVPDAMKNQVRQRGAASNSKEGNLVEAGLKGRVSSDATFGWTGQSGAPVRQRGGPVGRSGADSASVEDRTTKKKGGGPSNAALGSAGQSGVAPASVARDTVRRTKGHGRVAGPTPSGHRGSGLGDGSGCRKPDSPKSNIIGSLISIATGRRPTGKGGSASAIQSSPHKTRKDARNFFGGVEVNKAKAENYTWGKGNHTAALKAAAAAAAAAASRTDNSAITGEDRRVGSGGEIDGNVAAAASLVLTKGKAAVPNDVEADVATIAEAKEEVAGSTPLAEEVMAHKGDRADEDHREVAAAGSAAQADITEQADSGGKAVAVAASVVGAEGEAAVPDDVEPEAATIAEARGEVTASTSVRKEIVAPKVDSAEEDNRGVAAASSAARAVTTEEEDSGGEPIALAASVVVSEAKVAVPADVEVGVATIAEHRGEVASSTPLAEEVMAHKGDRTEEDHREVAAAGSAAQADMTEQVGRCGEGGGEAVAVAEEKAAARADVRADVPTIAEHREEVADSTPLAKEVMGHEGDNAEDDHREVAAARSAAQADIIEQADSDGKAVAVAASVVGAEGEAAVPDDVELEAATISEARGEVTASASAGKEIVAPKVDSASEDGGEVAATSSTAQAVSTEEEDGGGEAIALAASVVGAGAKAAVPADVKQEVATIAEAKAEVAASTSVGDKLDRTEEDHREVAAAGSTAQADMTEEVGRCGEGGGEAVAVVAPQVVAEEKTVVPADVKQEVATIAEARGEVADSTSVGEEVMAPKGDSASEDDGEVDEVDSACQAVTTEEADSCGEGGGEVVTVAASAVVPAIVAEKVNVPADSSAEETCGGGGSEKSAVAALADLEMVPLEAGSCGGGSEEVALVVSAVVEAMVQQVESGGENSWGADEATSAVVAAGTATVRADVDQGADSSRESGGEADASASAGETVMAAREVAVPAKSALGGQVAEARVFQERGGRTRSWKRLVFSSGILILTIILGVVGASLFQGFEKPPTCGRKTVLFEDGPLEPGECMQSDGGSRWFGWAVGMVWKSRLSASKDGGEYMGPDGSKVPLRNVVWETDVTGGALCSAERLVRKATGLGNARYGVSPRAANPLPRAGLFCHVKEPPSSPSVLSVPRRGTARFSEGGDLEVLNSRGKVLWSAREGMDLHRAGEKGTDKRSSDAAKAKDTRRRKREERLKAEAGEREATGEGGWGARVRKMWGKDGGGDGHAVTKPSGGQGRGIARVFRWGRGPRRG